MDELRRRVWNEAVKGVIETFRSKHEEFDSPLTIDCLDMKGATPIGESVQRRTRLFRLEIKNDENGIPTWDERAYPDGFKGGAVKFLITVPFRIDDLCEEQDLDLSFPDENNSNEKSTAEGEHAATA